MLNDGLSEIVKEYALTQGVEHGAVYYEALSIHILFDSGEEFGVVYEFEPYTDGNIPIPELFESLQTNANGMIDFAYIQKWADENGELDWPERVSREDLEARLSGLGTNTDEAFNYVVANPQIPYSVD